jgi:hypothetical protein
MIIRENFRQILQQFITFCFLFLTMKWLILSSFNQVAYAFVAPLLQLVLSSVFYVLAHKFFTYLSGQIFEGD